jgi:PHD/YefM family antitoxin component YafN of YafNO toxin-antitoxin module
MIKTSDETRRELRQMLTDVEEHGEHYEVVRFKHVAAVIVPHDWYKQAKAALAAKGEKP